MQLNKPVLTSMTYINSIAWPKVLYKHAWFQWIHLDSNLANLNHFKWLSRKSFEMLIRMAERLNNDA